MNSNMENYRKIEVVGKGSFGHAVLVQSIVDRKYFIMKIIDVSKMDRKQKEEALNEVNLLKEMKHPFIITYRESFMDKNRYLCIVMDYAERGDMYTKIAEQKKLGKGFSESQILDWFVQICLALKYVHGKKILHRDLKTQNIFLTAKGEIKIGDFGIARVLQNTYDCAQTAIGTPYYLSPEICQEKPYNQKSDIWSLGCILYELVSLRHAFDANNMKGLVVKILRGSYPSIPNTYSQELRDLIAEMLTKDPKNRPSVKKILEKEILAQRIGPLLTSTLAKNDLGITILKKVNYQNQLKENNSNLNPNANPNPNLFSPILKIDNTIQNQAQNLIQNINQSSIQSSSKKENDKANILVDKNLQNQNNLQGDNKAKVRSNSKEIQKRPVLNEVDKTDKFTKKEQIINSSVYIQESSNNKNAINSYLQEPIEKTSMYIVQNALVDSNNHVDERRSSISSNRKPYSEILNKKPDIISGGSKNLILEEETKNKDNSNQTNASVILKDSYASSLIQQQKENIHSNIPISLNPINKKENEEKLNNLINSVEGYLNPCQEQYTNPIMKKVDNFNDNDDYFQEEDDKRVYAQ